VRLIPGSPWSTGDGVSQSYALPANLDPSIALLTVNSQPVIGEIAYKPRSTVRLRFSYLVAIKSRGVLSNRVSRPLAALLTIYVRLNSTNREDRDPLEGLAWFSVERETHGRDQLADQVFFSSDPVQKGETLVA
jgi:hypothetical protein